jgi:hypothetical protein
MWGNGKNLARAFALLSLLFVLGIQIPSFLALSPLSTPTAVSSLRCELVSASPLAFGLCHQTMGLPFSRLSYISLNTYQH